jgi:hypothetical protein
VAYVSVSVPPRFTTPRLLPSAARPLGALALLAALIWALGLSSAARAATTWRTLRYDGAQLRVPTGWPVIDLAAHPGACVRFDRHAVYLGAPARSERCPAGVAGRTEAILVSPARSRAAATLLAPARGGGASPADAGRLTAGRGQTIITATWNRSPGLIARALGLPSVRSLVRHAPRPSPAAIETADSRSPARARAAAAAVPGAAFTGSGFDACSTPSTSQMNAWGSSPYQALGVYIGGENMACSQPNLTAAWVSAESAVGWHLIPIFVGLQAPSNSCGCAPIEASSATSEGSADAQQAVADAQAVGLGAGNPIYLDMESYSRTAANSSAVLAYVQAWTQALHAAGYRSGVYGNDNAAIGDLAAQNPSAYTEPDDIWIASWNGEPSTADGSISSAEWADHQRLHQYEGAHDETYSGTTINIDSDYVDAATAAAGSSSGFAAGPAPAPGLKVAAAPSGSLELTPSWAGMAGISSWQVIGAQSPLGATWTSPPLSAGPLPLVVPHAYAYYAVRALGASGQVLGTSAAVADPSHLALYGQSVFIPTTGPMGIPAGCFASAGCSLTTTVSFGRQIIARTGAERMSYGGGLLFASLTPAGERLLSSARGHRFPVLIRVRDASGMSVSATLKLTQFRTSGRPSAHVLSPSSALRLIGASDFVSHGWVGGLLVRCSGVQPCAATAKLSVGRQTITSSSVQQIGRGQIGYLMFTLTPAGHRLLAAAPGNQLPVQATVTDGSVSARGTISLISY